MSASARFAQVLSVKLEAGRDHAQDTVSTPGTIRTRSCEPVASRSFYREGFHTGARAYAGFVSSPRVRRRSQAPIALLSSEQGDALTALRKLGASLPDDFDARRLKAAFRRLALELHPDRHPGASLQRRQWLGVRFAVLCEAYQILSDAR